MIIETLLGIDAGVNGGIAVHTHNSKPFAESIPANFEDLNEWFSDFDENTVAILEQITIHKSLLKVPASIYRLQKLLAHYEKIKIVLQLNGIPYIQVMPIEWQKYLNLKLPKDKNQYQRKKYLYSAARLYYPEIMEGITISEGMKISDALLLLAYGQKKYRFDRTWFMSKLPPSALKVLL